MNMSWMQECGAQLGGRAVQGRRPGCARLPRSRCRSEAGPAGDQGTVWEHLLRDQGRREFQGGASLLPGRWSARSSEDSRKPAPRLAVTWDLSWNSPGTNAVWQVEEWMWSEGTVLCTETRLPESLSVRRGGEGSIGCEVEELLSRTTLCSQATERATGALRRAACRETAAGTCSHENVFLAGLRQVGARCLPWHWPPGTSPLKANPKGSPQCCQGRRRPGGAAPRQVSPQQSSVAGPRVARRPTPFSFSAQLWFCYFLPATFLLELFTDSV